MEQEERENFYHNSTLIVDHTNESFTGLLDHDLKNQNLTLLQFIQTKSHEIYHLCYNREPCCMCPPGSKLPVFRHYNRILHPAQLDILLDTAVKLPGHNPNNRTKHCCCPANPNINYDLLDLTLTRCLLVNFTNIIPGGSPECQAVEELIKFRNDCYGHATKGRITNQEYQINRAQIERCIMVLARVQGREAEFRQKLNDAAVRPLDETILIQFQTTLMTCHKRDQEIMEKLDNIECAIRDKSLPDFLVRDMKDVKVTEGCDAHFEIWTKDDSPSLEWFRDKLKIVNSDKFWIEKTGRINSLNIRNTDLSDKGLYFVKVQDFERCGQLEVKEYFTKNMKNTYEYIEGDIAELSCAVLEDNVTAHWDKDGVSVQQGDKYKIMEEGKNHKLSIMHVDLQDAGNYCVKISDRKRFTTVQVKEYYTQNLQSLECIEGEIVEFTCEVIESSVPALWSKNGNHLKHEGKYEILQIAKTHKVFIANCDINDAGDYTVNINNRVRTASLCVKEVPAAIRQMSEEDKGLYLEIIKTGTETRYYIRVMIIGENGVGKTCLLRRLLGESIEDVESTDGIDIVQRCKIRLSDGKWVIDKGTNKRNEMLTRIKQVLNAKKYEDANIKLEMDHLGSIPDSHEDTTRRITDPSEYDLSSITATPKTRRPSIPSNISQSTDDSKITYTDFDGLSDKTQSNISESSKDNWSNNADDEVYAFFLDMDQQRNQSSQVPLTEDKPESKLTKVLTETILNELSQFIIDLEKHDITDEVFVDCGFWDFAGQRHYYPTHQIFLNPNAVHLLVANIMKDIKAINIEGGYNQIGEYIDFWFDSIHTCGDIEVAKASTLDHPNPPVILVCTGIDKCKDKLDERKDVFREQVLTLLHDEGKHKHLRRICCVSNTEPVQKDFDYLRQSILEFGKEMKTFEDRLPLKWIRLEQALEILREADVNILSWFDIIDLAEKCSINNENEINLFLKYQHIVGSIIYFESLKEHIIINQKWLADAFRCLVSDKFDDDLKLTNEWQTLLDTGELKHSFIMKFFEKEREREFYKHENHLLRLMEMFGIIVKLTTSLEDGQRQSVPSYYMPCMLSKKTSITKLYDVFGVKKELCTPWLCVQFEFMPIDFFNHVICYYVRKYSVCTEALSRRIAIYHGMGVFILDKFRKFVLCFSKNTIALQVWQWKQLEQGKCKEMLEELRSVIYYVSNKFEPRRVSYIVKTKCASGNIHIVAGRLSFSEVVDIADDEDNEGYVCDEHNEIHDTGDFFQTWFEDYSDVEHDKIPYTDFFQTWFEDYSENMNEYNIPLEMFTVIQLQQRFFSKICDDCESQPSVYWCHTCVSSMCEDCNYQHMEFLHLFVQSLKDKYSIDFYFKVKFNRKAILLGAIHDINLLHDGLLVAAVFGSNHLVTCDMSKRQEHFIPLPDRSFRLAVVDDNTVAVSLVTTVVIVDVRQRQVIQNIDVKENCFGVMYRDNQLFVGCNDSTIKIITMSGEVKNTIPVDEVPKCICGGEKGLIYYTDCGSVYCIEEVGKPLFTFTDPVMDNPLAITKDEEGHILVICDGSNNVFRISPDGKQSQVIIAQIPNARGDLFPSICYNFLSKSVVIGRHDTVYVYKKV